jgi:hypothetical protein
MGLFPSKNGNYDINLPEFFFIQILQFKHQSKALVEFIRNMLFLKIFISISGLKKPINRVKIRIF